MLVFEERGKLEYSEKNLSEKRTNSKLNPHVTSSPGIEPGPHWWKASAFITAPTLLPPVLVLMPGRLDFSGGWWCALFRITLWQRNLEGEYCILRCVFLYVRCRVMTSHKAKITSIFNQGTSSKPHTKDNKIYESVIISNRKYPENDIKMKISVIMLILIH